MFLWKIFKKTKLVRLEDIPLREVLDRIAAEEKIVEPRKAGWIRAISWLWD